MATETVNHAAETGISKRAETLRNLFNDVSPDFAYILELCEILNETETLRAANRIGALADSISLLAQRAESKIEAAMEASHG